LRGFFITPKKIAFRIQRSELSSGKRGNEVAAIGILVALFGASSRLLSITTTPEASKLCTMARRQSSPAFLGLFSAEKKS
jgi:hypothetical protein